MVPHTDYDQWHTQYITEEDSSSPWHAFIKNNLDNDTLRDRIVLEIGCGRGGLSDYLISRSIPPARLYACDYSTAALDIARSRFHLNDRVVWKQEDIQQMTFADKTFDIAISCETIEHVPDAQRALRELYRVLKPGGRLILTCPNYFNFFGIWCVYRYLIGKPYTEGGQPYVNYLLYPRLRRWLRQAGFKLISAETSNLVLPLRAHYHLFTNRLPRLIQWLGFRSYFILEK
jgi:ubiquinone/menaquinone biosynthesis C-methylase UbiE